MSPFIPGAIGFVAGAGIVGFSSGFGVRHVKNKEVDEEKSKVNTLQTNINNLQKELGTLKLLNQK